jgi:hypothetical protein
MKRTPHQLSFASAEFAMKKRVTRRERFLADMERMIAVGTPIAERPPHRSGVAALCSESGDGVDQRSQEYKYGLAGRKSTSTTCAEGKSL